MANRSAAHGSIVAAAAAVAAGAALLLVASATVEAFVAPAAAPGVPAAAGQAASSPAVFAAAPPRGAGLGAAGCAGGPRAAALAVIAVAAAGAALIVQNKGGGHGEIGYHLALNLAKEKGLKVTMITDSAAKKDKPPFDSYSDLEAAGVEIKFADLAEGGLSGALDGMAPCEYVFDNQNICPKDVQKAVSAWSPKAYAYVSSGGMYKPIPEGPLLESGAVKEDNKQLGIERNAADAGLNWSAFRPQYIYGPKANKRDCIDWFLDRVTRDLPIPLPVDGSLRTTFTNAEDVAGMLASVVGAEDSAKCQVFNCATDVRLSHNEVVKAVAKAVGKDAEAVMKTVVYYDPAALKGMEVPKKGKLPLRETHFGVGVDKAKVVLGWSPKHTLEADLPSVVAEYRRLGKDQGDIARDWDEAVLKVAKSPA